VKKLHNTAYAMKDAETKGLIADLTLSLADLKIEMATIKEECQGLKEQLKIAGERTALREHLELCEGAYRLKEAVGSRQPGMYCSSCFETKGLLIPLTEQHKSTVLRWLCDSCKSTFGKPVPIQWA
jgi:hypothetical protein